MRSKSYAVYLVLALAALALWFARPSARERSTGPAVPASSVGPNADGGPTTTTNRTASANAFGTPGTAFSLAGAPRAADHPATARPGASSSPDELNPSLNQAAQIDVGRVRHMIGDYHTLMGENPVGTNAEIMKQLMGSNSHQATLGPPDGMSLNAQGELVDQWGTPYFFHQLSRDKMEVRSAGPDKVMWTADDVVAR